MVSLHCSITQIKCFDLSFDMCISHLLFFVLSDQKTALNQAKHALNVAVCLCMSVRFCVYGLHASVQACVRTVAVPPSENRWVIFF